MDLTYRNEPRDLQETYRRLGEIYDQVAERVSNEHRWNGTDDKAPVNESGRQVALLMHDLIVTYRDATGENPREADVVDAAIEAGRCLGFIRSPLWSLTERQRFAYEVYAAALIAEVQA